MPTSGRAYAAVIAIAAFGVLGLSPAAAIAHGKGKQTLRLVATEDQFQPVDLDPPGPSLGDELVFSETLSQQGEKVGVSGVVCTVTHVTPPYDVLTYHCVGTLSLRRGQITLQGLIEVQAPNDPGPFTVAITGGTGAFVGADGQAVVRRVSDTRSIYTLRFDSAKNSTKKRHHHHHR